MNDFAHVIQPDAIQRMERIAEDVRTKSRGEMTIVTLPDIGTRDVQEVALEIGRQWKVGKIGNPGDPTRNAGAVILLVPKETSKDGRGHCFIATGRGAEGFITDADAGDICREATPAFMQKDYSTGLELVTLRTAERFAKEFNFQLDTSLAPPVVAKSYDYPSGNGGGSGMRSGVHSNHHPDRRVRRWAWRMGRGWRRLWRRRWWWFRWLWWWWRFWWWRWRLELVREPGIVE